MSDLWRISLAWNSSLAQTNKSTNFFFFPLDCLLNKSLLLPPLLRRVLPQMFTENLSHSIHNLFVLGFLPINMKMELWQHMKYTFWLLMQNFNRMSFSFILVLSVIYRCFPFFIFNFILLSFHKSNKFSS
jgi:hypothetical protein